MWFFLASDCMFFGSLIAMYLSFRGAAERMYLSGQGSGPVPHEILDIPYTSISAFVLLMSSLTMVLAVNSVMSGDTKRMRLWLGATCTLGGLFLAGQVYEFTEFLGEGLGYTVNVSASAFYTLTGFHGAHVAVGIIMLLSAIGYSFRRKLEAEAVEVLGLYWHFVDIVWVVIFAVVYLIP